MDMTGAKILTSTTLFSNLLRASGAHVAVWVPGGLHGGLWGPWKPLGPCSIHGPLLSLYTLSQWPPPGGRYDNLTTVMFFFALRANKEGLYALSL